MKKYLICTSILIGLFACKSNIEDVDNQKMGVQAILWYQFSAEAEALYIQGYNVAGEIVRQYDFKPGSKTPAVTLDIDETVLDNSPFSVHQLRMGYEYSEERWAEWCEKRAAKPLPGSLKFINLADSLGIEVYYVSNRHESLLSATLDNLREYNFPNADSLHVLLKTNSSSKDERRARILENHDIILLIGDNLGDFEGVFDYRQIDFGKQSLREFEKEFGTRFIVFPNPMYGNWVKGVFPEGLPEEDEVLKALRGYE